MCGNLRLLFLALLLSNLTGAYAAIPEGYYNSAEGTSGAALKTCMFNIIKGHTELSYVNLWTAFRKTDSRADGKVWDIYSNATNYVFGDNQCGNYSKEGDCYNREHSFPKSWFGGDNMPMYTDLFHLYPSDGYVNGKRGNMPLGNVANPSWFSANGYCCTGNSTESGSTITVFEPADELKGDLARSYFYMVTRYEDRVASWSSYANTQMLGGTSYPAFSNWAKNVLLEWSRLDPVSAKEIARNDSIYKLFQHNRNPYIDFSSLAEYVWGDSTVYAFNPSKYLSLPDSPEIGYAKELVVWSEGDILFVKTNPGETVEIYNLLGQRLLNEKAESNLLSYKISGKKTVIVKVENRRTKFSL